MVVFLLILVHQTDLDLNHQTRVMWPKIAIIKGLQGHLAPALHIKPFKRLISTALPASKTNANRTDHEWTSAKSFQSIPGPGFLEAVRWFLPGG